MNLGLNPGHTVSIAVWLGAAFFFSCRALHTEKHSKFQKEVLRFAEQFLPEHAKVFFIYTYGMKREGYTKAIAEIAGKKNADILGEYGCLGFNTFGPLKLMGGMGKGHPNQDEISNAVSFYRKLSQQG